MFFVAAILSGCATQPARPVGAALPRPHHATCANCVVGGRVFFDAGSSHLRRDAQVALREQAAWLKRFTKVNIVIAGSGDERDDEDHALALGYERAYANRDFLVKMGVSISRITVVSYGREHPVILGHGERALARSRTATTFIPKI